MGLPFLDHREIPKVLAEDGRQRVAVGKVEVAERRDRDVELDRVGVGAEDALRRSPLDQRLDLADQRGVQLLDLGELLEEGGLVQVLRRQQAYEPGLLEEMPEGDRKSVV